MDIRGVILATMGFLQTIDMFMDTVKIYGIFKFCHLIVGNEIISPMDIPRGMLEKLNVFFFFKVSLGMENWLNFSKA